ncbi:glutamate racemase [Sinomicrobium weinanense]|uniref:Glutamate racemase n=1 Tax=Sinomicrobium weinanense TaxID=2842200 RepID=A0A926JSV8_9FLAO|nr:glutamate racemase [Sinomicrobium weinanense]MBC9796744.1 glutamate racemase [Sinomicrobium weinanense]MBU3124015.1 glutamate racemase [Sinomicrobium weinanense]
MHIAFFDSGVGGLTVLHEAMKKMPGERFIYFGDARNAPYGTRTKKEIRNLVFDAVEFLAGKGVKALVLACNTATSAAVTELREKYDFPIIGMEPAVKPAVENSREHKVLVCATDLTLKEEKLNNLVRDLNAGDKVDYLSLQELVMFAEHFKLNGQEVSAYLKEKLSQPDWNNYDSIVLGCTHFIFFREQIRKLVPDRVCILDGNEGTVNNLMTKIEICNSPDGKEIQYYISGERAEAGYYRKYLDYLLQADTLKGQML